MNVQSSTIFRVHVLRALNKSFHACRSFWSAIVSGAFEGTYGGGRGSSTFVDPRGAEDEGCPICRSKMNISFYLMSVTSRLAITSDLTSVDNIWSLTGFPCAVKAT